MTVWNIQNCSWVSAVEGEDHPALPGEIGHPHQALLALGVGVAASHKQNVFDAPPAARIATAIVPNPTGAVPPAAVVALAD